MRDLFVLERLQFTAEHIGAISDYFSIANRPTDFVVSSKGRNAIIFFLRNK